MFHLLRHWHHDAATPGAGKTARGVTVGKLAEQPPAARAAVPQRLRWRKVWAGSLAVGQADRQLPQLLGPLGSGKGRLPFRQRRCIAKGLPLVAGDDLAAAAELREEQMPPSIAYGLRVARRVAVGTPYHHCRG